MKLDLSDATCSTSDAIPTHDRASGMDIRGRTRRRVYVAPLGHQFGDYVTRVFLLRDDIPLAHTALAGSFVGENLETKATRRPAPPQKFLFSSISQAQQPLNRQTHPHNHQIVSSAIFVFAKPIEFCLQWNRFSVKASKSAPFCSAILLPRCAC